MSFFLHVVPKSLALRVGLFGTPFFFISLCFGPAFAQSAALPSRPIWSPASEEAFSPALKWTKVENFGDRPAAFLPIPSRVDPAELSARPRVEGPYKARGIFGVGGGIRAGIYTGDPTNAVLTTRFGYKLDESFSISLRPAIIFSDYNNNNNNDFFNNNEFRLPLTLDLFHGSLISPYIGGGVATNADGLGYTDGMFTGGLDINITKYLTLGVNLNYIYQSNIDDTDWEALGMLYLRF